MLDNTLTDGARGCILHGMTRKNGAKVRQISFSGIRAKRLELGLTKLQMADLIGLAENTYGRLENDITMMITRETIEKILNKFPDLSLEDVIIEVTLA